jgi:hypothetical protein
MMNDGKRKPTSGDEANMLTVPGPDLSAVFGLPPGYHGTCWAELAGPMMIVDRPVPAALWEFLTAVQHVVRDQSLTGCVHGCAYVRVVDAGRPENYMSWHTDNHDGGVRFATSIATDGARVNLAWPADANEVGVPVEDTDWQRAVQPANGRICVFTTELHGVVPQPARPGELTANFFATFYPSRAVADLWSTNNTATAGHQALPVLEATR